MEVLLAPLPLKIRMNVFICILVQPSVWPLTSVVNTQKSQITGPLPHVDLSQLVQLKALLQALSWQLVPSVSPE